MWVKRGVNLVIKLQGGGFYMFRYLLKCAEILASGDKAYATK